MNKSPTGELLILRAQIHLQFIILEKGKQAARIKNFCTYLA